jgi:ligand-binding sensor domain-containing protein/serine phosphatase RsbU (regulator of sigma subunit)
MKIIFIMISSCKTLLDFLGWQSQRRTHGLLLSLFLILFLFVQCIRNSGETTLNSGPGLQDSEQATGFNTADSTKTVQVKIFDPPRVIYTDTCPKPVIVKVPEKKGGFYTIYYETGPVKIDLIPPTINLLPMSTDVSTGLSVANPEAQGVGFFNTYTTDNGLALDGITSSIRDKSGNLWFTTAGGGVSRYDGKSFTGFTTSQGLANNSVWCLAEDQSGNIWFGTQTGISRYDGKSFTSYTTDQGLSNNIVRCVTVDRSGNIWFGTNGGGVSRFDGKSFTGFTTDQGLAYNFVYDIREDKSGKIWICTVGGGVSCYDGKAFTSLTKASGLPNNIVISMTEDRKGNLWFGTYDGGVSRYDGKTFTNFTTANGLANNTSWRMLEDDAGNLWFGTNGGGVSRYDGRTFTNFTTANGLANNNIWSISEDRSGNIWFGTLGGGLSRYNGKSFTNFTTSQGLSNNLVRTIVEDKKGSLWFGTDIGGLSRYDGRSFTTFSMPQGLNNSTVWAVAEDKKGNLWIGTAGGGVSKFDGKSFTGFTKVQGLGNDIVRSIYEDTKGNLWFGIWEGGASMYDGKYFTNYTTAQGLANNNVLDIIEDITGNIWFGTYGGGVSRFDGKTFTSFTTSDGLVNNNVKSIMADKAGNLWFGTEGGISVLFSDEHSLLTEKLKTPGVSLFKNLTVKEGLINNSVMQIIQTRDGVIYAGTNLGLCEILLSRNETLRMGSVYNSSNGYPVKDINSGFNTLFEDSKGIIWAATGSDQTALVRFDPKAVVRNQNMPEVVLQRIKVNNENISWYNLRMGKSATHEDTLAILNEEILIFGKELADTERISMRQKFGDIRFSGVTRFFPIPESLALPYAHNNVTFEFNALVPSRNFLVRYQYLLEGYDKEWSPLTFNNSASFGNIFEGTYIFKLKACSPDGVWSDPISYKFKVLPPVYRTWWMYTIYVLVFVTVLFLFYRWRVAKLEREKQILEEKVKLRTAELQQANEEIEAQRDLVTRQKDHIEEIHKEVTDSINYAKRLQASALPNKNLLKEYFSDLFILFKPKDLVSGDFYWFAKVKNHIIVTVADCTGHGVPGAFMSMLGISLLKEIVIKESVTQPDVILNRLRNEIIKALGQTGESGEQKDGMDISLCSINTEIMEMQWSGANNPCLIIKDGELIELKADKMPIAIYEKMDDFTLHKIKLQKNNIIYLFGDGYHDQFGGPDNKKFMSKRFKELLLTNSAKPMTEQYEILNGTIEEWMNSYGTNYPQTDDITVMGLKIS